MAMKRERGTERIQFFDGSLLASRDLRDDAAHEARMRALHVPALHDTWGVALGFNLRLSSDKRQVLVTPGLAYDCHGREILLSASLRLHAPVPPPSAATTRPIFDLVVRYDDQADFAARRQPGPCLGAGLSLMEDRAALRWSYAGAGNDPTGHAQLGADVRLGEDIPLGRFTLDDGSTLTGPNLTLRRTARALLRPHIALGLIKPGALEWTPASDRASSVLVTTVDTAAAGFGTVPHYFATLPQNPRFDEEEDVVVGPFVSLYRAERTAFKLRLLFAYRDLGVDRQATLLRWVQKTSVFWMGAEPFAACAPAITSGQVYDLSGNPVSAPETIFPEFIVPILVPAMEGGDL